MENQLEILFKCLKFAIDNRDCDPTKDVLTFATEIYKWQRELSNPESKVNSLTKSERDKLIADALLKTKSFPNMMERSSNFEPVKSFSYFSELNSDQKI